MCNNVTFNITHACNTHNLRGMMQQSLRYSMYLPLRYDDIIPQQMMLSTNILSILFIRCDMPIP
uniref:Uncharacterized protein n=1 Tax=viral metagenome TaxID=1070528 RepID=A0A6C0BNU4_9ZZZZ